MLFSGELLPKVFNIVIGRIIGLVPTDIWLKLVVFINGTLMAPIHNKRSPFNKVGYQSRELFSICTLFSNLCLSFVVVLCCAYRRRKSDVFSIRTLFSNLCLSFVVILCCGAYRRRKSDESNCRYYSPTLCLQRGLSSSLLWKEKREQ